MTSSFAVISRSTLLACCLALLAGCGGGGAESSSDGGQSAAHDAAPVARAGAAQNVVTGTTVTLDGSASSDADGDPLSYRWTLTRPVASTARLDDATSATPRFVADVAGTYTLGLVVDDGHTDSPAATTTVTATSGNAAPVAHAGPAQNTLVGTTVTLDGSASSDANGDAITFAWTLAQRPVGSAASLAAASTVNPTFVADVAGTYVAALVVNDGQVDSAAASVTVTAEAANVAPVAKAGSTQSVVKGSVVTLDGSASSDANGDALAYAWSLTAKPAGSAAQLVNPASMRPTFTADVAGIYVASLVVDDGRLSSESASVIITVSSANAAPVADAGAAQSAHVGEAVRLDGSRSSDADGDALTYAWTVKSHPGVSSPPLSDATTAQPVFTATDAGAYVFSLVVNDGRASSAPSNVTVTVADTAASTASDRGRPDAR